MFYVSNYWVLFIKIMFIIMMSNYIMLTGNKMTFLSNFFSVQKNLRIWEINYQNGKLEKKELWSKLIKL